MSFSRVPVNLVSVNTAPERAKRLIGRLIEDVKDKYSIRHAGNSESETHVFTIKSGPAAYVHKKPSI